MHKQCLRCHSMPPALLMHGGHVGMVKSCMWDTLQLFLPLLARWGPGKPHHAIRHQYRKCCCQCRHCRIFENLQQEIEASPNSEWKSHVFTRARVGRVLHTSCDMAGSATKPEHCIGSLFCPLGKKALKRAK